MPPCFSLSFELKKSPTVIEDFYNAITKTDLKLINCDNDYSLDAAIAINQVKLNDDFVLGYEDDFTNDYISLYLEHPDFSYTSLHICNIQNSDIVCFNLIIPEDDFLLYESATLNVTEIISNAKPPKRLYDKMNIIKELAIKMWNAVPTVLIQTSWELSDDLVLSNDIDDNCIPLIEPFCIIPESLVKASWGLKGTKLTNNSILIEENKNWNNVFCDVDEWIKCESFYQYLKISERSDVMREFKIIDLRSEEVELPVTDDIVCFFIVNNINDENFINNLASKLLKPTSINYIFFGKHEKAWHLGFDEAHIERYPNSTWETVALTDSWSDIEDFADQLYSTDYAYTPETEVLLYYDDDEILKKVKELLPIMEQRNLASEEDTKT